MEGWIKLYRKIEDNPLYFSEPFTRIMAWIDLLILANHKGSFFYCRGIRVDVKSGQVGRGIETLADRWKWSRGKVERFLNHLEKDNQIVRQKNNVTTLISIVNWCEYQEGDKANSNTNGKASSKADGQQTVKQTDIIKNDKKVNNVKNDKEVYNGTDISFNNFWKTYKKKTGYKKSLVKWNNGSLSKKKKKLAIDYLPGYKKNEPDKFFRQNPLTYLNGETWNDELIKKKTPESKQAEIRKRLNKKWEKEDAGITN